MGYGFDDDSYLTYSDVEQTRREYREAIGTLLKHGDIVEAKVRTYGKKGRIITVIGKVDYKRNGIQTDKVFYKYSHIVELIRKINK